MGRATKYVFFLATAGLLAGAFLVVRFVFPSTTTHSVFGLRIDVPSAWQLVINDNTQWGVPEADFMKGSVLQCALLDLRNVDPTRIAIGYYASSTVAGLSATLVFGPPTQALPFGVIVPHGSDTIDLNCWPQDEPLFREMERRRELLGMYKDMVDSMRFE
jgi:hypothetical protein